LDGKNTYHHHRHLNRVNGSRHGVMTLSITTFSIAKLSMTRFGITTFSI